MIIKEALWLTFLHKPEGVAPEATAVVSGGHRDPKKSEDPRSPQGQTLPKSTPSAPQVNTYTGGITCSSTNRCFPHHLFKNVSI